MKSITKVLIANRGEIALRVIRAARELGIKSVAVYSDADEGTLPMRVADERIALKGARAAETYLNQEKILEAALQSGADAVHPGYGFFAENPDFAEAVEREGLILIGPQSRAIRLMASKDEARKRVREFGVPVVPGTAADATDEEIASFITENGFPVVVKAVAGGSGKGMRVVEREGELKEKIAEAKRESLAAFKNDQVILERYLRRPRHIEVQVFGDSHGSIIHLGERECSLQRRHQKVTEESPAPNLHPDVRARLCEAAIAAAKSVEYTNAGTIEFLVEDGTSKDSPVYFLEMNTRIQVEHPVTEMVTGVDLVKLQFVVARGEKLPFRQSDISVRGHAIEFRVNAEDPAERFRPTAGKTLYVSRPGGNGVREDGWIESGTQVSSYYDSLLSKLIVCAESREAALTRARTVLDEYTIEGLETTLGFHRWLLRQEDFIAGHVDTGWIERVYRGEKEGPHAVGPLRLPKERG